MPPITTPGIATGGRRCSIESTLSQPERVCLTCTRVADPATAEPYRLGITLLSILSRQPGFEWRDKGDALTRLVGTRRLVEDLRAGKTMEEILAADAEDHETWRRERRAALIYPEIQSVSVVQQFEQIVSKQVGLPQVWQVPLQVPWKVGAQATPAVSPPARVCREEGSSCLRVSRWRDSLDGRFFFMNRSPFRRDLRPEIIPS